MQVFRSAIGWNTLRSIRMAHAEALLETREIVGSVGLPLVARGKVRDVYAVGEKHLLFVASDRVSAFDVVMKNVRGGASRCKSIAVIYMHMAFAICVEDG